MIRAAFPALSMASDDSHAADAESGSHGFPSSGIVMLTDESNNPLKVYQIIRDSTAPMHLDQQQPHSQPVSQPSPVEFSDSLPPFKPKLNILTDESLASRRRPIKLTIQLAADSDEENSPVSPPSPHIMPQSMGQSQSSDSASGSGLVSDLERRHEVKSHRVRKNSIFLSVGDSFNPRASYEVTDDGTLKTNLFEINSTGFKRNPDEIHLTAEHFPSLNPPAIASIASPRSQIQRALGEFNGSNIIEMGILGRGAGGRVVKALHKPTLTVVALKCIDVNDKGKRSQLAKELKELDNDYSPHIVSFYSAFYEHGSVKLALEYMNRGSLQSIIEKKLKLNETALASVAKQALLGLEHLHNSRRVHRDVKPGNMLLDWNGRIKLSDFGLVAELRQDQDKCNTFVGCLAEFHEILLASGEPIQLSRLVAMENEGILLPKLMDEFGFPQSINRIYSGVSEFMYRISQGLADSDDYFVTPNHELTLIASNLPGSHLINNGFIAESNTVFIEYFDNSMNSQSIRCQFSASNFPSTTDCNQFIFPSRIAAENSCFEQFSSLFSSGHIVSHGSVIKLQAARVAKLDSRSLKHLKPYRYNKNPSNSVVLESEFFAGEIEINEIPARMNWVGLIVDNLRHNIVLSDGSVTGNTMIFMSPERLASTSYSYSADIWSLGMSLITLVTGQFPLNTESGYWGMLTELNKNPPPSLGSDYSPELRDFVSRMLVKDPAKRWTVGQLLEHQFIVNGPELEESVTEFPKQWRMFEPNAELVARLKQRRHLKILKFLHLQKIEEKKMANRKLLENARKTRRPSISIAATGTAGGSPTMGDRRIPMAHGNAHVRRKSIIELSHSRSRSNSQLAAAANETPAHEKAQTFNNSSSGSIDSLPHSILTIGNSNHAELYDLTSSPINHHRGNSDNQTTNQTILANLTLSSGASVGSLETRCDSPISTPFSPLTRNSSRSIINEAREFTPAAAQEIESANMKFENSNEQQVSANHNNLDEKKDNNSTHPVASDSPIVFPLSLASRPLPLLVSLPPSIISASTVSSNSGSNSIFYDDDDSPGPESINSPAAARRRSLARSRRFSADSQNILLAASPLLNANHNSSPDKKEIQFEQTMKTQEIPVSQTISEVNIEPPTNAAPPIPIAAPSDSPVSLAVSQPRRLQLQPIKSQPRHKAPAAADNLRAEVNKSPSAGRSQLVPQRSQAAKAKVSSSGVAEKLATKKIQLEPLKKINQKINKNEIDKATKTTKINTMGENKKVAGAAKTTKAGKNAASKGASKPTKKEIEKPSGSVSGQHGIGAVKELPLLVPPQPHSSLSVTIPTMNGIVDENLPSVPSEPDTNGKPANSLTNNEAHLRSPVNVNDNAAIAAPVTVPVAVAVAVGSPVSVSVSPSVHLSSPAAGDRRRSVFLGSRRLDSVSADPVPLAVRYSIPKAELADLDIILQLLFESNKEKLSRFGGSVESAGVQLSSDCQKISDQLGLPVQAVKELLEEIYRNKQIQL